MYCDGRSPEPVVLSGGVSPSFAVSSSSQRGSADLIDVFDCLDLTDLNEGVREGLLPARLWLAEFVIDPGSAAPVPWGDCELPLDLTLTRPVLAE
jgi:hypothetical protein